MQGVKRKRSCILNHGPEKKKASQVANKLDCARDKVVDHALSIFKEAWVAFAIDRDAGNGDKDSREDRASANRELAVAKEYGKIKAAVLNLLPWLGRTKPCSKHCNYRAMEFKGRAPPACLEDGKTKLKMDKLLGARLAHLRKDARFRVLEAFCALMAIISARKERHWLEPFGCLEDIEWRMKKKPGCKSKTSTRRREAIRAYIENECTKSNGYFSTYLVKPIVTIRAAFACRRSGLVPASLVIYERLSLFDALGNANGDDGDAPLMAEARSWEWCKSPGRQFAFQEANFDEEETATNRNYRMAAKDLQPDPKLRGLLLSKKPVVYLEVVAALAPRDVAKKQGHSEIVKAELARLMGDAKRRGEAVVLVLGSDSPHTLAQKVYMRKPISDYGLRCGYLRWRASADVPWRRERNFEDRTCLCLQMP